MAGGGAGSARDVDQADPTDRVKQSSVASGERSAQLTLDRALALSLLNSPELAVFSFDTRAAEARTLQAGYRPNPEISTQTEDFGGTRGRGGLQQSQTTLALSQIVELGDKRTNRVRLARLDENLAAWDYETKRLDVFVEVTKAFVAVLAAQRKQELADAMLRIEQELHVTVMDRIRAGRVSPLEQRRADVTLANGRIASDKANRELREARDKLTALWGDGEAVFIRAEGDLNDVTPPPPFEKLAALITQNPEVARWMTEIQQREARVTVERSKNVPDITLQGGVRRHGDGGTAFVAGIGIPLPLFGLNRGNLGEAQAQLGKSHAQQRAAEVRVAAALRQSYMQLAGAYDEIESLRRDVLPAAEAAFSGINIGYRDGKFGLLEVLEARRAQSDAQARLVDALSTYQNAVADTERLTGQSLHETTPVAPGEKR